MKFDAFIGGSNPSGSLNVDLEHTVNLYLEMAGEGVSAPKARNVLYARPGLSLLVTLPQSPVRAVWANAERMFAVAGSKLYEVFFPASGFVTTHSFSTLVNWSSGDTFADWPAGTTITINGTNYTIDSITSGIALNLTSDPTLGTAVPYSVAATYSELGDVGNDGLPAQIFANGTQIMVVSAGLVYCDNGDGPVQAAFASPFTGTCLRTGLLGHPITVTWVSGDKFSVTMLGETITIAGTNYTVATVQSDTILTLTATGPAGDLDPVAYSANTTLTARTGAFLDGYFLVNPPDSKQVNFSAINDGTSWDASDFFTKAGYPDNIQALIADHEELWALGTDTTEVFQDNGSAPFIRIPGAFIHHGSIAISGVTRLKEGVAWLVSEPSRGGVKAVYAQGFQPQRISTHAIETVWRGYSTVRDAVTFSYEEDGHEFWVISFPTAGATWVFDATAGVWLQWGWWNGTTNDRIRQAFHAFWEVFNVHVVGDWQNGNLYIQSTQYLTDNGTSIMWSRTAPHLSTEQLWNFYSKFQIDMEVGQSTSSPLLQLSWSDDGGHTFSTPINGTPSDATYAGRLVWWRLGRSRDRVFRVTGAVPSGGPRTAIIQALLDVQQGIG